MNSKHLNNEWVSKSVTWVPSVLVKNRFNWYTKQWLRQFLYQTKTKISGHLPVHPKRQNWTRPRDSGIGIKWTWLFDHWRKKHVLIIDLSAFYCLIQFLTLNVRFISWEIRQYFRVQFNARQSSIPELQLSSVTYIPWVYYYWINNVA